MSEWILCIFSPLKALNFCGSRIEENSKYLGLVILIVHWSVSDNQTTKQMVKWWNKFVKALKYNQRLPEEWWNPWIYFTTSFDMCLGSFSCWNTQLCPSFNHLANGLLKNSVVLYYSMHIEDGSNVSKTASKQILPPQCLKAVTLYDWSL